MLFTQRLELVEGTVATLRAAIDDLTKLGELVHARVPASWPPEHLDRQAIEWMIRHLEDPARQGSANFYWVILRDGATSRTLVGGCGYHTPSEGTLQVGYGLVPDFHRRGIATEATRAVVAELSGRPNVKRIVAETYPDHVASLGVMRKCGFEFVGPGSEAGTVQYEFVPG